MGGPGPDYSGYYKAQARGTEEAMRRLKEKSPPWTDTTIKKPGNDKPRNFRRAYGTHRQYQDAGIVEHTEFYKRHPEELPAIGAAVGVDNDGYVRHLWPEADLKRIKTPYHIRRFAGFIKGYKGHEDIRAGFAAEVEVATIGLAVVRLSILEGHRKKDAKVGDRIYAHGPDTFCLEKDPGGLFIGKIHTIGDGYSEVFLLFP